MHLLLNYLETSQPGLINGSFLKFRRATEVDSPRRRKHCIENERNWKPALVTTKVYVTDNWQHFSHVWKEQLKICMKNMAIQQTLTSRSCRLPLKGVIPF